METSDDFFTIPLEPERKQKEKKRKKYRKKAVEEED